MTGIYKLTSPSGKVYVGKSYKIQTRIDRYRTGHCKRQPKLYNSINKYGFENHEVDILEECSEGIINEREIYWIEKYDSVNTGLNCVYGGEGGRCSEETKLKMSKSRIGLKCKTTKYNPIYQYDLDGNFIREWHNARQCAIELNTSNGYLHTVLKTNGKKTTKGYMFVREKVDKLPPNTKWNGKKKQVIQYDMEGNIINEYPSAKQAAKALNASVQNITAVCRGETKTCGGFIWKYKNQ